MRNLKLAAIQMTCQGTVSENIDCADKLVRAAAREGAQLILLPELFETRYFCQERNYDYYKLATTVDDNPAIQHFRKVCEELKLVMPISFYERHCNTFFNSAAIIDADGTILGVYRKTHIPDDHFYQEKFYFSPGDTGFKVWETAYAKIGVGICWDQWFPEAARSMALLGAEVLLYPTAIGSEPILECDSMPHWRRVMQGHAAANLMPVIAANRIGTEVVTASDANGGQNSSLTFYGSSFIADETGALVAECDRTSSGYICYETDLDIISDNRSSWGLFRDRRPEMYGPVMMM